MGRDEVLTVLRDRLADRTGLAPETIGEDAAFADLQVDSLSLVELGLDLEEALGVELREQDFAGVTTVGGFADAALQRQRSQA